MKSKGSAIEPRKVDRLNEASDWLLRLQEPTRTEADYDDWLRWCDEDPENFAAFELIQRRWRDLDALKGDDFLEGENSLVADSSSWHSKRDFVLTREQQSALFVHETKHAQKTGRRSWLRARRMSTVFAVAAGLATLALTVLLVQRHSTAPEPPPQQVAAAMINRAATLPDGSKMILGAQSLVNMDFNGSMRQLDISTGEAYFQVKHDKERPFVVQAGEVSVTAIGTAFDVRRNSDKVVVTVEEGTVEVRGASRGESPAVWRAEAGHQLTYSTRDRTASLARIDPAAMLTWRNGELAYLYEPLGSVVENLNRYSGRKIVIADAEVADIPFTGTAFAAALDDWLAGVERAYPIEVTESASGEIVLSARK